MLHPHTLNKNKPRRRSATTVIDSLFLAVCAILATVVAVGIFALPKNDFSEDENRSLAPLPTLSLKAFTNGSFFSSLSSFCSDHIPMRSELIRAKTALELTLGKRENNSVLFCEDGRLISRCDYDDMTILRENLSALSRFCNSTAAECALIPRSIDICVGSLPARFESSERCRHMLSEYGIDDSLWQRLISLSENGKELYYLTDHHLNSEGAYSVYVYLSELLDFEPMEKKYFSEQIFSEKFLGSTYSRGGLIAEKADTITLYRYNGDDGYTISCEDTECSTDSLYDLSAINRKDKYLVFQGGNHGVLHVSSDDSKPSLLLIKDSFANAVLPLLAIHFDLTVIDPRYASATVSTRDFDHIVVLCGIDTLATNGQYKILFLK